MKNLIFRMEDKYTEQHLEGDEKRQTTALHSFLTAGVLSFSRGVQVLWTGAVPWRGGNFVTAEMTASA